MRFDYSPEQQQFRSALRDFFAQRIRHTELPTIVDGFEQDDPSLWAAMASDLGLQGLTVPERLGGQGFGTLELGLALHEAGYALLPGSLFATACLAVEALKQAAGAASDEALTRIAGGSVATLAFDERDGARFGMTAEPADGRHELSGVKTFVAAGATADLIVATATGAHGPTLFLVDADAPGLTRTPQVVFDPTRPMALLEFNGVTATALGEPGDGVAALDATLRVARAVLAAEQAGGAERALAIALEYAGQRMAFGRPIGSFQAIKHRCADTFVEAEAASSLAQYAAWACDRDDDAALAVAMAASMCSDAYLAAARACVQILGGIGFTVDHPAHLHFRRATASAQWLGTVAEAREILARAALEAIA